MPDPSSTPSQRKGKLVKNVVSKMNIPDIDSANLYHAFDNNLQTGGIVTYALDAWFSDWTKTWTDDASSANAVASPEEYYEKVINDVTRITGFSNVKKLKAGNFDPSKLVSLAMSTLDKTKYKATKFQVPANSAEQFENALTNKITSGKSSFKSANFAKCSKCFTL